MATATIPGYRPETAYTTRKRSRAGEHEGDMEGTTHAATGLLLGACTAVVMHAGARHGTPWPGFGTDVLFGLVTGGFALLPDADHPKASFARAAGPLSHGISHLVAVVTGGHRRGMHSLAGIAAVAAGVQWLAVWHPTRVTTVVLGVVMAICIAAGLGATGFARHGLTALLYGGVIAAAAVHFARGDLWWLAAMGMALHIAEDMFTGHGVALAWPLTSRRFGGTQKKTVSRTRRRPAGRPVRQGRARPDTPPVRTTRPPRQRVRSLSLCPECAVDDHQHCYDRHCQCPQAVERHPYRPVKTVKVTPEAPDEPPF